MECLKTKHKPHRMSILYAYMSQPHYELWSKKEEEQGRTPTKELFMKEFGTPLITFSADGRDGFHPLPQGSSIVVNFQYYNELNKKFESLILPIGELNEVKVVKKSIGHLFDKLSSWITSRIHL
jgi:hypothetical protein